MIIQIKLDDGSLVAINTSKICQVDWTPDSAELVVVFDTYMYEMKYGCGTPEQARNTYITLFKAMQEDIE